MTLFEQISTILGDDTAVGKVIEVRGWVRTKRDSKGGFSFIHLYDGSCFDTIQVVADQALSNYSCEILHLSAGSSIHVRGLLVESQGKNQPLEIQAQHITILGNVDEPESYPIAKKRHSFEYLRTVAHLRPRTNTFGAITRLRSQCALTIHQYLHDHGFFWVNTPIITASDCEGAGELFRVSTLDLANLPRDQANQVDFSQDFFGTETYLTVSGQLNVEAYCLSLSRVYTFGPTFRAENSNTSRHLAEFWMIEPEIAFADLADNVALAEDFLKTVIKNILNHCERDLEFFNQHVDKTVIERLEHVTESQFEQIDYTEAVNILQKAKVTFEFPVQWGLDLQSEHERFLTEQHVGRPVVVMNYPQSIKAFYMRANDDDKTCAAMDILVPGIGEIIGGSQREERFDVLDAKLQKLNLQQELSWYSDLRRYGTVPHAGFGLGFERLLNYMTGLENIRDVVPYPRTPQNAPF